MLRRAGWISFATVFVLVVLWHSQAPVAAWDAGRGYQPKLAGTIDVDGLASAVTIRRDTRGVPHIRAAHEVEAWFGLGFAHAQDRLGQMLWLRRLARGTSSEIEGSAGLPVDRLVRTLGLGRLADAEFAGLDPASGEELRAYAAGVNAQLGRLSAERVRALLDAPASLDAELPWSPADSIALMKLLHWTMGPSLEAGIVFAELVEALGGVGARPLLPTGLGLRGMGLAFELPEAMPARAVQRRPRQRQPSELARSRARLAATVLRVGAWVVPGEDSASGSPLLAAEFQLAPSAPVLVYEAHLSAGRLDVVGATVPGLPVYWTGRNANVAWALTPGRTNSIQLYRETLRRVGKLREFQTGKRWSPLIGREEVIRVRTLTGDLREETLHIESTRHGPLINHLIEGEHDPLSLAWLGAGRGDGLESLIDLLYSSDADDLVERLAGHQEPVLAVVYADRKGTTGWQLTGWIPKLLLGTGLLPTPGRQLGFNWVDRVRYTSLPNSRGDDAPRRWIIAADNPLLDGLISRQIEWTWRNGTRSRRIEQALGRLRSLGPIDLRGLAQMQTKLTALLNPKVMPALESLLERAPKLSPEAKEVWQLMRAWDGRFAPDRRGAAVYRVFAHDLVRKLLATKIQTELVDRYLALSGVEPSVFVEGALVEAASKGLPGGWGDPALLSALLPGSLHQAWVSLSYQRGPNRERWNWGGLHHLAFRPFVDFDTFGGNVLFSFGSERPYPGNGGVVGMADCDPTRPYAARSAALYRIAVDLAADDRILTSLAPGQSELPGQPHYRDGLSPWLNGNPRMFARSSFLVEEHTADLLRLEPIR
jgi:penicillin amidase